MLYEVLGSVIRGAGAMGGDSPRCPNSAGAAQGQEVALFTRIAL